MPTMTLVELRKRVRDQLIAGVVGDIYTTNKMWEAIPWLSFSGPGILVNREDTLGDAQFLEIGATITAKAPSAVDQVLFAPTTALGDAEINGLQTATTGGESGTIVSQEIASKAKSVGRLMQQGIATGDGASPNMNSLHSMIDSSQYTTSNGVGGAVLTFEMLDELIDLVKSKDGLVDWIFMNGRDIRAYRTLCRAQGGEPSAPIRLGDRTITMDAFNGIPIFQNDWLSTTETDDGAALTGGAQSSIYAGVWDDGTKKIGLSMIYPEGTTAGIGVEQIGAMETKDERIYRVKAYMNLAAFNKRGVARLTGINPAA